MALGVLNRDHLIHQQVLDMLLTHLVVGNIGGQRVPKDLGDSVGCMEEDTGLLLSPKRNLIPDILRKMKPYS